MLVSFARSTHDDNAKELANNLEGLKAMPSMLTDKECVLVDNWRDPEKNGVEPSITQTTMEKDIDDRKTKVRESSYQLILISV